MAVGHAARLRAPAVLLLGRDARPEGGDARQILGTIAIQGDVRIGDGDGTPVERSGAALLEGSTVRVATGGTALLALRSDGGRRTTDGLRIELDSGEVLTRLPVGSRLSTATAVVRAKGVVPASAAPPAGEARIRIFDGGRTLVGVQSGAVRVSGARGSEQLVRAGEEATVAKDDEPRVAAERGCAPGNGGTGASVFSPDPGRSGSRAPPWRAGPSAGSRGARRGTATDPPPRTTPRRPEPAPEAAFNSFHRR